MNHASAKPSTGPTDGAGVVGNRERALVLLAQGQGAFYVLSGLWPLLSPATFQWVTGPKEEFWLVRTVSLLLVVAGAVLFLAGRARRVTREIVLLGAGHAAMLAIVDVFCVFAPRTTGAYWLDAVLEIGLVAAWILLASKRAGHRPPPGSARHS